MNSEKIEWKNIIMATNNYSLALTPLGNGTLNAYIGTVNSLPYLNEDEEHELALRYYNKNDLEAARQLVLSHLRYVVKISRGFLGYGIAHQELIQEGNIGLMKAVKKFDPNRGVRLATYAIHWIKAEIYEFILRNWKMVRIATTKAQKKVFFNLRKFRKNLEHVSDEEVHKLSSEIDVDPETIREMESRINAHNVNLDTEQSDVDGGRFFSHSYYAIDDESDPAKLYAQAQEKEIQSQMIHSSLANLDERSRDIIAQRHLVEGKKATLQKLGDKYGVSAERIRQIEKKAFFTLREAMSKADYSIH